MDGKESNDLPHLSQGEMKTMLKYMSDEQEQKSFDTCCKSIQPCSNDIAKIADGIESLYQHQPRQYVGRVSEMEVALLAKCEEIKKQKRLVRQLLGQNTKDVKDSSTQIVFHYNSKGTQIEPVITRNFSQQMDTEPEVITKIEEKIVEKIVTKIVEVEKVIEKPIISEIIKEVRVEVPVETVKIVEVEKIIEKIIEKPIEKIIIKEIEKIVEVPVIRVEIKEVEKIVERIVNVEVIKQVEKIVEVPVFKEKLVEVEKIVERPVEVIKEVIVEKPVYMDKIITVDKFIDRPVEVIKEIIVQKPYEITKIVEVEKIVEIPYEVIKIQIVEVPTERIVEKVVEKMVPVEKEIIKVVKKVEIREVERIVEVPIIKTVVEQVFNTIEKPVVTEKIVEVDRVVVVEKPTIVEKIVDRIVYEKEYVDVEKLIEVPVIQEKIHHFETIKEMPVEVIKFKTVEKIIEVPVEYIKIQQVEKIVEVIKEVEKYIEKETEDSDCDCLTGAKFITTFNKLFQIKGFVGPDCLTETQFIEIISKSFNDNASALMKNAEGRGQGSQYPLVTGKALEDDDAVIIREYDSPMGRRNDNEKRSGIKKSAKIVGRKTMQPEINSYDSSPVVKKLKNNYTDDRFSASQERYASETDYQSKQGSHYYNRDNIAAKSMKITGNKNLFGQVKQENDKEIFMKLQEKNKEKRQKIKQDLMKMNQK